mmetsp:Transcript_112836/g.240827  ORF Transcript_112836/g.240827 Transcript_112836/m.240827 type:complete len:92 (-) Transcript_112836:34-309(-)
MLIVVTGMHMLLSRAKCSGAAATPPLDRGPESSKAPAALTRCKTSGPCSGLNVAQSKAGDAEEEDDDALEDAMRVLSHPKNGSAGVGTRHS